MIDAYSTLVLAHKTPEIIHYYLRRVDRHKHICIKSPRQSIARTRPFIFYILLFQLLALAHGTKDNHTDDLTEERGGRRSCSDPFLGERADLFARVRADVTTAAAATRTNHDAPL